MAEPGRRGARRKTALVTTSVAAFVASFAFPAQAQGVPAAAAPTQTQINATQAQIASLEQKISQQQAQAEALSQRYDATLQRSQDLQAAMTTTGAQITVTKQHLAVAHARLVRSALNAYILATPGSQVVDLFTSPVTLAAAHAQYENQAIGGLAAATEAYVQQQTALSRQQARLQGEQHQALTVLSQVQSLRTANTVATQAAQATLTSAQGTLAQQVAEAAAAKAAAAAAAAAAARRAAAARQAAAAAAAAASVAATLGDDATASAAAASANAAAAAAGSAISVSGSPTGSAAGMAALKAAISQLGVPYVWGGNSPSTGFDCSGLTQWSWQQAGVSIPRVAADQWAALPHVPLTSLQPGDLLFYFNLDGDNTVDHVVMYAGSGPYGSMTIVQAPHTGATVSYSPLFTYGLVGAARP